MAPTGQNSKRPEIEVVRMPTLVGTSGKPLQLYLRFDPLPFWMQPKRNRRKSIKPLITQARKAGEHGTVIVKMPDGTVVTSSREGAVEEIAAENTMHKILGIGP